LGDVGDTATTTAIIPFASSRKERERIAAVSSLGKLQDSRGWDAIFECMIDTLYTVRSAAVYALAAQDKRVLLRLDQEFSLREVERLESLLLGCAAMGERWKGIDSLKKDLKLLAPTVKRYLEHPDARVQGAALVATAQVLDEATFKKSTGRFERATDALVRGRYRQALRVYQ
jgi:HEAT repeat protein